MDMGSRSTDVTRKDSALRRQHRHREFSTGLWPIPLDERRSQFLASEIKGLLVPFFLAAMGGQKTCTY